MKNTHLIRQSRNLNILNLLYFNHSLIITYNNNLVILNSNPLYKLLSIDFIGELSNSLIFNNTQCLLLTGQPYSPNKLIFYDSLDRLVISIIEFNQSITSIDTSDKFIAICLESSVYLYSTSNSYNTTLLHKHSTHSDPISQINTYNQHTLFISSGSKLGHLHVIHLQTDNIKSTNLFQPHKSKVSAISISSDNQLFATCSIKGTIIRIYNSNSLQLTHQLRRGSDTAVITSSSLSFSLNKSHFALISDKSSIHLWNLSNTSSNYFSQSRSTSIYHLPSLNLHSSLSPFISSSQQYANYNNFQESFILAWESEDIILIASTFGRFFTFLVTNDDDNTLLKPLDFKNFLNFLT